MKEEEQPRGLENKEKEQAEQMLELESRYEAEVVDYPNIVDDEHASAVNAIHLRHSPVLADLEEQAVLFAVEFAALEDEHRVVVEPLEQGHDYDDATEDSSDSQSNDEVTTLRAEIAATDEATETRVAELKQEHKQVVARLERTVDRVRARSEHDREIVMALGQQVRGLIDKDKARFMAGKERYYELRREAEEYRLDRGLVGVADLDRGLVGVVSWMRLDCDLMNGLCFVCP